MNLLRRLAAATVAAVVMATGGAVVAHADASPSVYSTPGGQLSQGRLWNTTCEKYSSNVVRCRTEIWATTVEYSNGAYRQVTGWAFNNLSYLPSARAAWSRNNLGHTAAWVSQGRRWKTECDSAATGRGGCRTFVETEVVSSAGGTYTRGKQWVFNNQVQFSSASIPGVTTVPSHILDQSSLTPTGFGPLQVGTGTATHLRLGYLYPRSVGTDCQVLSDADVLTSRGVQTTSVDGLLFEVRVESDGVNTTEGARVGMTVGQLRGIYGAELQLETKQGFGEVHTATITRGGYELLFTPKVEPRRPLQDSDVIGMMTARKRSASNYGPNLEGC